MYTGFWKQEAAMTQALLKKITIRIPPDLDKKFRDLARRSGKSQTHVMRLALQDYIGELEDIRDAKKILSKVRSGEIGVRSFDEWEND